MPAGLDRPVGERFRRLRDVLAILNSLGAGEAIAILVIALIVLGPEKLPDAIRKFGNIYGELRRMSHGFQSELRDAFDEPLRELRGTAQMMQDAVNEPARAVKAEMTAPVVGGGKQTKPAEKTEAPTDKTETSTEESQAPVEESQAPVDDGDPPTPPTRCRRRSRPPQSRGTAARRRPTRGSQCSPRPACWCPSPSWPFRRRPGRRRWRTAGRTTVEGADGAESAGDHEPADTDGADELGDGHRDD